MGSGGWAGSRGRKVTTKVTDTDTNVMNVTTCSNSNLGLGLGLGLQNLLYFNHSFYTIRFILLAMYDTCLIWGV